MRASLPRSAVLLSWALLACGPSDDGAPAPSAPSPAQPAPAPEPTPASEPTPAPEPDAAPATPPDAAAADDEAEGPDLETLSAVPEDAPALVTTLGALCRAGDPRGCWLLGEAYGRGIAEAPTAERRRGLFEWACAGEGGYGCAALAALLPPAERAEPLRRGCAADRADACASLAEVETGAAATRARMRACSLGATDVCLPVPEDFPRDATPAGPGARTEVSRVPPGAPPTVHGVAQRCDRGMAAMCAWLGLQYAYDNPYGLARDEAHALALARRACNEEAIVGCFQVGSLLLQSDNVADAEAAGGILGRSCAAGNGMACMAVARVSARLPEAADVGATYGLEACVLGDQESCAGLGGR